MSKAIDVRFNYPSSAAEIAERMKFFVINKAGEGAANYRRVFGPRQAHSLGMSFEELVEKNEKLAEKEFEILLLQLAEKIALTPSRCRDHLDEAGIEWGLIFSKESNDRTTELVSSIPGWLKGMTLFNPFKGAAAVRELEGCVKESGHVAAYVWPYGWRIKANDSRFYPCYAKACELDIPVFIYTAMNYNRDVPMDIGRPLYLDRVAMDFPELRIVASVGGWPWIPELVGLARRHPNVYIDTSSHRPKYLNIPGSGFEMLMHFGNTLLQDQIVFGSGAGDLAMTISQVIKEVKELPLKEEVKEKWLYRNALKLFKLDQPVGI